MNCKYCNKKCFISGYNGGANYVHEEHYCEDCLTTYEVDTTKKDITIIHMIAIIKDKRYVCKMNLVSNKTSIVEFITQPNGHYIQKVVATLNVIAPFGPSNINKKLAKYIMFS